MVSGPNTSYSSEDSVAAGEAAYGDMVSGDAVPEFNRAELDDLLEAALEERIPSLVTVWDRLSSEQCSEALKLIGLRQADSLRDLVLKCLDADNARERANAVEVLGKIDHDDNLARLEPFLDDGDNRVRANAVLALWNVMNSRARKVLRDMLQSDNMWMRASAAYVLTRVSDETVRPELERLLDDEHDTVREKAIAALGVLGPGPSEHRLLHVLKDEAAHPFIKTEVLKALRVMGRGIHTDSASRVLQIAQDADESDYVRLEAVKTLGHIGEADAEPFISELAGDREVDEYLRGAAVEALGAFVPAENLLLRILADPMEKDSMRERASFALGRMSGSHLVVRLRVLLNEENEDLILSLIARLEERGSGTVVRG